MPMLASPTSHPGWCRSAKPAKRPWPPRSAPGSSWPPSKGRSSEVGHGPRLQKRWEQSCSMTRKPAQLALEGLGFEELLETEPASLTTVARLLVAAERRVAIEGPSIEVDLTGAQPASHGQGAVGILGPDGPLRARTSSRWRPRWPPPLSR